MALGVGALVGGYRVERVLGSGGMGTVYLAANPVLPRYEALKVLNAAFSNDPQFRARFIREADLAAGLDQPNIVAVYNRGETADGELWIAMQYVPGTDADREIKEGRMNPARAVYIVGEVAKALDYAHRRKLTHRDVKPANFLLTPTDGGGERVLLADFGIARGSDDTGGLTQSGAVVSTMAYGAPETLAGGPVDARTDVYSLGCSLYRMLTGVVPFGGTVAETATGHLMHPPPRATDRIPTLPPGIDAVIAKAMAKNPQHRFQSAGEFAAAAAAALQQPAATAAWAVPPAANWGRDGTGPYTPPAQPPRRRRRWVPAALVAVVAVAAIGAGVGLSHRGSHPRRAAAAPTTDSPAVDVSLLDTGGYAIKPTMSPFQMAGDFGGIVEAFRLAEYVVGPWQIDKDLQAGAGPAAVVAPMFTTAGPPVADAGDEALKSLRLKHGLITGFIGFRNSDNGDDATVGSRVHSLITTVLSFSSAEGAATAASETVATTDEFRQRLGEPAMTPLSVENQPQTIARIENSESQRVLFWAVTPYKSFIIEQYGVVAFDSYSPYRYAQSLINRALEMQRPKLDKFTPTADTDLSNLPMDPTHYLLSRTVTSPDQNNPPTQTVYRRDAQLFFEDRPVEASVWLKDAGVDWVSQKLATVYRTGGTEQAANLSTKLAGSLTDNPDIRPVSPPAGMPTASCFERLKGIATPPESRLEQQARWHFKCIDHTDRYVFTTFSNTEKDAKQQLGAQYRLLAGV